MITVSTNEALLRSIVEQLDLTKVLSFVEATNPAAHLEYHNTRHCLMVARWSFIIGSAMGVKRSALRNLVAAALLHDYAHTGVEEDCVNITLALEGIGQLEDHLGGALDVILDLDRQKIKGLIEVTEYPFIHEPQTACQRILRDADIMSQLEPDFDAILIQGLRRELEKKWGREISVAEFCKAQLGFMQSLVIYTDVARAMFDAAMPNLQAHFEKRMYAGNDYLVSANPFTGLPKTHYWIYRNCNANGRIECLVSGGNGTPAILDKLTTEQIMALDKRLTEVDTGGVRPADFQLHLPYDHSRSQLLETLQ